MPWTELPWDGIGCFFGRLCLIFRASCETCAAIVPAEGLVLSSPTLTLRPLTLATRTLTTTLMSAAFSFLIWVAMSGVTYSQAPAGVGPTPSPTGAAVYFI